MCDLIEPLGLRQPTVSHHLRVLWLAGLVDRRQERTFVYYSVREEAMNHLATLLAMGRPGVAAGVSPPLRVGINGFGRMGRLALRAGWGRESTRVRARERGQRRARDRRSPARVRLRARTLGRRHRQRRTTGLSIAGTTLGWTDAREPAGIDWAAAGVDLVLECSGRFRSGPTLAPHLERGVAQGRRRRPRQGRLGAERRRRRQRRPLRPRAHSTS